MTISGSVAWALVVMITFGGTSLVGDLVLCVGSDGHADLEVALGMCCVDENNAGGEADGDPSTGLTDPCGNCADIDLDATPSTKEKYRLEPPNLVAIFEAVQVGARPVLLADSDPRRGPDPLDLEALSTVVLLT